MNPSAFRRIARHYLPPEFRHSVARRWLRPARWGNLRRLQPFSRWFGFDRGLPVDRYYIERFLQQHRSDIRGRVLEIADSTYIRRFGGDRVTRADVLHAVVGNPHATLVGDLSTGEGIPQNAFDCLILTQTLPFIFDVRGAIQHSFAALKPGGVLLGTTPGISQISRHDMDNWGDYWRFTTLSARRLFEECFPSQNVTIGVHGNVLVATALLQGLTVEELTERELNYQDPDFELIITVRAVRPKE